MTYDMKCRELAKVFLSDCKIATTPERLHLEDRLAAVIQHAIEDFLEDAVPAGNRP